MPQLIKLKTLLRPSKLASLCGRMGVWSFGRCLYCVKLYKWHLLVKLNKRNRNSVLELERRPVVRPRFVVQCCVIDA